MKDVKFHFSSEKKLEKRLNELPMRTTRYSEGSVVPSIIDPNVYILHAIKTKNCVLCRFNSLN